MVGNVVTAIIATVCLFCKGCCTELDSFMQMYDRMYANFRFSERIVDLSNVSHIQCVSHCAKLPKCYFASYNRERSECDISNDVTCVDKRPSMGCFVKEDGWDVYQRDWGNVITVLKFSLQILICVCAILFHMLKGSKMFKSPAFIYNLFSYLYPLL